MYLEAVAMLPQIYMFQKQAADEGGTVEVTRYAFQTKLVHPIYSTFLFFRL